MQKFKLCERRESESLWRIEIPIQMAHDTLDKRFDHLTLWLDDRGVFEGVDSPGRDIALSRWLAHCPIVLGDCQRLITVSSGECTNNILFPIERMRAIVENQPRTGICRRFERIWSPHDISAFESRHLSLLSGIDGVVKPLVHVFFAETISRRLRSKQHRLMGGKTVILGDSPVFSPVTNELFIFKSREDNTNATGADACFSLDLLARERGLGMSSEESEHLICIGARGDTETVLGCVLELIKVNRHIETKRNKK